jgi:hypothetical protein
VFIIVLNIYVHFAKILTLLSNNEMTTALRIFPRASVAKACFGGFSLHVHRRYLRVNVFKFFLAVRVYSITDDDLQRCKENSRRHQICQNFSALVTILE